MYELALRYPQGPVSVSSISEKEKISVSYLEQLLNRLKKRRLVEAERGPKGGYRLSRAPETITLGDVVRVLENGMEAVYNETPNSGKNGPNPIVTLVWEKMARSIKGVLDSMTLKDLCEEVKRLGLDEILEHRYTFHI